VRQTSAIAWHRSPASRWDLIGVAICLIGAGVILFGPRVPA
jgi:drug/metabolite transporter superfamily protein YnfA